MPRRKAKKEWVYLHKATTNEYLVALAYHPTFIKLLNLSGKNYEKVVDWFKENEEAFKDEDYRLPSIKELSEHINLDRAKLSKYLKDIYEDILTLNEKEPKLFMNEGQILCDLTFTYLNSYAFFNIGLDVIPRIDDCLSFNFIRPKNGGWLFYVKEVRHQLDGAKHSISVSLTSEYPNKYFRLLKEKAYLHHYIDFKEFLEPMNDTEVEKLVKWYKEL